MFFQLSSFFNHNFKMFQERYIYENICRWEKFPAGDTKVPLPSLIDAVLKYASSATNGLDFYI